MTSLFSEWEFCDKEPEMVVGVKEYDFYLRFFIQDEGRRTELFKTRLDKERFIAKIYEISRPSKFFPNYARANAKERGSGKNRAARYHFFSALIPS